MWKPPGAILKTTKHSGKLTRRQLTKTTSLSILVPGFFSKKTRLIVLVLKTTSLLLCGNGIFMCVCSRLSILHSCRHLKNLSLFLLHVWRILLIVETCWQTHLQRPPYSMVTVRVGWDKEKGESGHNDTIGRHEGPHEQIWRHLGGILERRWKSFLPQTVSFLVLCMMNSFFT